MMRPRKVYRPTHPTPEARDIEYALMPLDKIASDMEARWGVNVLPSLVPIETAAKFGSALAKLDAAIEANDAEAVQHRAAIMARGWEALDRAAVAAGHKPAPPEAWLLPLMGGGSAWVVKDDAAASAVAADLEGQAVYTLAEIAKLLSVVLKVDGAVAQAKAIFPGSKIHNVAPPAVFDFAGGGDEIPF